MVGAIHGLGSVGARALGFSHVSDDDFARVTIAQAFATSPRLDPSGTSWLPFPFWILGAWLRLAGRSLASAQAFSILVASLAASLPYLALRFVGAPRQHALVGSALAFATPWAVWLGAATVPESVTASALTAAAIALGGGVLPEGSWAETTPPKRLLPLAFALAMTAASLSRYESWPVAAVLAVFSAHAALRTSDRSVRRVVVGCALVSCMGPLLWMAWNAHAHDGPLHFFRRVSSFKRGIGEGSTDVLSAVVAYPRMLLTTRPEVTFPALLLVPFALRRPELRRRWCVPLVCVLAQLVFLAYGNARDGAPAHHPERALLGPLLLLAFFVADVGLAWALSVRRRSARLAQACVVLLWGATTLRDGRTMPGTSVADDRHAQLGRGARLRTDGVRAIVVTPCAFEHFALIAAYGAPEQVVTRERTNAVVTEDCPAVTTTPSP